LVVGVARGGLAAPAGVGAAEDVAAGAVVVAEARDLGSEGGAVVAAVTGGAGVGEADASGGGAGVGVGATDEVVTTAL
jgi:hypothetical protein